MDEIIKQRQNIETYGDDLLDFLYQSNAIEGEWSQEAHDDAITAWDFCIQEVIMTPEVVKETHRLLMQRQYIDAVYKGNYRDCDVRVGTHVKLPHALVPNMVEEWCDRMNEHDREHDEDELHVLYENIHPFIDGNGRTGRIFYNWLRAQRGEPIYIFWEDEKQEYYKLFK